MKFKDGEGRLVLVIVVFLLIAAFAVIFAWSYNTQRRMLRNDLKDKAKILTEQLNAMRIFLARNQRLINENNGVYKYKNLGPERVAAEVADRFNAATKREYFIKLPAPSNPRDPRNKADAFELEQMKKFKGDRNIEDVFEETTINGKKYYKYMKPIYMSKHCVKCHGEPKGEIDVSGYPKEGYKIGDLTGAVSITVPAESMNAILRENTRALILFLLAIAVIVIPSIFFLTRRLVTLKKEVEDVNAVLSKKNEELMKLEKIKSDLTHMIVHDFRGTLANIMGYLALLVDSHLGELNSSQKEFTESALINSKKLLNMAADLLDISKMEEDRMPINKQKVNLKEVFEEKEDFWTKSASLENKEVTLDADKNIPEVYTDKNVLERILDNLVYNAIKHTIPSKGKIKITCKYDKEKNIIVFSVSDNGYGIPKEYLEKVFDKFFQIEAAKAKKVFGVGLGLTFCKMATESLGGAIRLESEEGKGTTAILEIRA